MYFQVLLYSVLSGAYKAANPFLFRYASSNPYDVFKKGTDSLTTSLVHVDSNPYTLLLTRIEPTFKTNLRVWDVRYRS